jgi:hypothetical protein
MPEPRTLSDRRGSIQAWAVALKELEGELAAVQVGLVAARTLTSGSAMFATAVGPE